MGEVLLAAVTVTVKRTVAPALAGFALEMTAEVVATFWMVWVSGAEVLEL